MKNTIKLIAVLVIICAAAGSLLAYIHKITASPIAETEKRVRNEAMKEVLPEYDNDPVSDSVIVSSGESEWTFHIAKQGSRFVGAAFEATSSKGYGGDIVVMVGVTADNSIQAIKILKQKETPGLGAKVEDPDWRAQFSGKSISGTKWAVKKDQGDIDQITAATISSRAVTDAIKQGLDVFTANRDQIVNGAGDIE